MIQSVEWKEKRTKSWEAALFHGWAKEDKFAQKSKEKQSDMGETNSLPETKRKEYFKKCQEMSNESKKSRLNTVHWVWWHVVHLQPWGEGAGIRVWEKLLGEINPRAPFSCKSLQIFVMEKYISKLFYNEVVTSSAPSRVFSKFGTINIYWKKCTANLSNNVCNFSKTMVRVKIFVSFLIVLIKIFSAGLPSDLPLHSNSHNRLLDNCNLKADFKHLHFFLNKETDGTYQILGTVLNYSSSEA